MAEGADAFERESRMQLSSVITPERIKVPLVGADKLAVITELVDLLATSGAIANRDAGLEAVLKRESEGTTGIGYGLAIPHGKTDTATSLVMAAGKPAQPVDFQSLDKRPVSLIVMIVRPPEQTGQHIQALAKISRLMNIEGFRAAVEAAESPAALHAAIAKFESRE